MRKSASLLLLLCFAAAVQAQTSDWKKKSAQVDQYIDSLMKGWNIPGMAIGIVQGDQLVYAKGFGYRNLEQQLKVDTATLFPIASNSKLFTATVATEMALEGKLDLDKPVRNYLPELLFSTDELNAKASLRDLLSHRTGLPRYDAFWVYNNIKRDSLLKLVTHMQPQLTLREGYIYNNVMYATAGIALEKVGGASWETLVRQRLFAPLQMKASCFLPEEMTAYGNCATSYFQPDSTGKHYPVTHLAQSLALGPAGTIKSTVGDMSHWMMAQLNKGMYKGVQAIPAAAIEETVKPQSIAEKSTRFPELSNALYCLGRTIQTYKGRKLVMHTGSIDGFYSCLVFLPDEKIGVFMVHNAIDAGSLRGVMGLPVLDIVTGSSRTPWSARYREDYVKAKVAEKKNKAATAANQKKGTAPSHPLADYAGEFEHPVYGSLTVSTAGDQLALQFRSLTFDLHHYHYDQFHTDETYSDKPDFEFEFRTGEKGNISGVEMNVPGEPGPVLFTRKSQQP